MKMIPRIRTWFIIVAVLLLDVVTIGVPLFSPRWRWVTVIVLTAIALFLIWLRWLDWRAQDRYKREAFAALARLRRGRSG